MNTMRRAAGELGHDLRAEDGCDGGGAAFRFHLAVQFVDEVDRAAPA
jgi:hypothetical protein